MIAKTSCPSSAASSNGPAATDIALEEINPLNAHLFKEHRWHDHFAQLSFGYGVHFCMGSRLAELQLRILWEELLERFERVEVQHEPERTLSSFVNGYTPLPVEVTRK